MIFDHGYAVDPRDLKTMNRDHRVLGKIAILTYQPTMPASSLVDCWGCVQCICLAIYMLNKITGWRRRGGVVGIRYIRQPVWIFELLCTRYQNPSPLNPLILKPLDYVMLWTEPNDYDEYATRGKPENRSKSTTQSPLLTS